jgi:hypothetical protein
VLPPPPPPVVDVVVIAGAAAAAEIVEPSDTPFVVTTVVVLATRACGAGVAFPEGIRYDILDGTAPKACAAAILTLKLAHPVRAKCKAANVGGTHVVPILTEAIVGSVKITKGKTVDDILSVDDADVVEDEEDGNDVAADWRDNRCGVPNELDSLDDEDDVVDDGDRTVVAVPVVALGGTNSLGKKGEFAVERWSTPAHINDAPDATSRRTRGRGGEG